MHSISTLTVSRDRQKPASSMGEADLHSEYEERGDQCPCGVDGVDDVVALAMWMPYQCAIFPSMECWGTLRIRNQRYVPSAPRTRVSTSNFFPASSAERQTWRKSRSSSRCRWRKKPSPTRPSIGLPI